MFDDRPTSGSRPRRRPFVHTLGLALLVSAQVSGAALPCAAQTPAAPADDRGEGQPAEGQPAEGQPADAQAAVAPEADRVLKAMAAYLGALPAFGATLDVDQEIVTLQGQKLQFSSSGEVLVQRPGYLHARRRGGEGGVAMFITPETITIAVGDGQTYMEMESPGTIDAAIDLVRSTSGLDLPGADLLYSDLYAGLMTDVTSGSHLGTGIVNGAECEHLAFRAPKADWQIWVRTGDAPLPCKYVITSTWVTGAPQYSIRLRDWNVDPEPPAAAFAFDPPEGAEKVDRLAANVLGEFLKVEVEQ